MVVHNRYDLKTIKVEHMPALKDCPLYGLIAARSKSANALTNTKSGLRYPDLVLAAYTEAPVPTPVSTPADTRSRRSSRLSQTAPYSSDLRYHSHTSTRPTAVLPANRSTLPGIVAECKASMSNIHARQCLGKVAIYLLETFEAAGTFLAMGIIADYFIRLAAVDSRHIIMELDLTKWVDPVDVHSFADLLTREDIASAFVLGGHQVVLDDDERRLDSTYDRPPFADIFQDMREPFDLAHDLLANRRADQLLERIPNPSEMVPTPEPWGSIRDNYATPIDTPEDTDGMDMAETSSELAPSSTGKKSQLSSPYAESLSVSDSDEDMEDDDEEQIDPHHLFWKSVKLTVVSPATFKKLLATARPACAV